MTINDVYEKYKHFDKFFCDTTFVDSMQAQARYDMWQAIRAAVQAESTEKADNSAMVPCLKCETSCMMHLSYCGWCGLHSDVRCPR